VIDHGRLRFDGDLDLLVEQHAPYRRVRVVFREPVTPGTLTGYGEVLEADPLHATLQVSRPRVAEVTARLLAEMPVEDVSIEDPPIEEVIRTVFADG
jgi:ABC-2 type transport system ATP-binding protein